MGTILFIPFMKGFRFSFSFRIFYIIIFGRNCDAVSIHQIRFSHSFSFIGWIGFTSEW